MSLILSRAVLVILALGSYELKAKEKSHDKESKSSRSSASQSSSKLSLAPPSSLKGEESARAMSCLEEFNDFYWNTRAKLSSRFSSKEFIAGFLKELKTKASDPKAFASLEKKLLLTTELNTHERIEEYLNLFKVQLRELNIFKPCEGQKSSGQKSMTDGAHSLKNQMKSLPVQNPWTNPQNEKSNPKDLVDELLNEEAFQCSRDFKNHLLNWMSRSMRTNVKNEDFKTYLSNLPDNQSLSPLLREFALNTFFSKALKGWDPFFKDNYKNIPSQKNMNDILDKIQSELKQRQSLRDTCVKEIPLSTSAQEDLRALRIAGLRDDFTALVNEAMQSDESCSKVVTGNAGERSVEEINNSSPKKTNIQKNYPFFMAYSFLSMACQNWSSLSPEKMKNVSFNEIKEWQKTHPYKRSVLSGLDTENDALSIAEFRQSNLNIEALQAERFKQSGIQNLILSHSLVYALSIRETNANPLKESSVRQSEVDKDTGLCHNSATSLGTDEGMGKGSDSVFPYAMDLLKNYVQKARYLAKDKTPEGINRFKNFCGTSSFDEKYLEKGVKDPQGTLLDILSQRSSGSGKNQTCDQKIDSGPMSYKSGNIAACFRAMQLYCPSYGAAHANLVVRAMKRNNGPLSSPSKGLRPACHKVFSDIVDALGTTKGKKLCELTEDFSIL